MSDTIDISKLDKAEVLAALYNASKQHGMGFLHARGRDAMTTEQAKEELAANPRGKFDYLHGRAMKIYLAEDNLEVWIYDRDNGKGAAQRALQPLIDAASK